MNRLSIGVASMVAALCSGAPAYALPQVAPTVFERSDVIEVRDHGHGGHHGGDVWHGGHHFNRGYSGYGWYHHRDHDGNAGAIIGGLAAGAIIGGVLASQPHSSNAHIQYCSDRYRSYRASDNTFQPNDGPRLQCR